MGRIYRGRVLLHKDTAWILQRAAAQGLFMWTHREGLLHSAAPSAPVRAREPCTWLYRLRGFGADASAAGAARDAFVALRAHHAEYLHRPTAIASGSGCALRPMNDLPVSVVALGRGVPASVGPQTRVAITVGALGGLIAGAGPSRERTRYLVVGKADENRADGDVARHDAGTGGHRQGEPPGPRLSSTLRARGGVPAIGGVRAPRRWLALTPARQTRYRPGPGCGRARSG